jgi:hypothetical protein
VSVYERLEALNIGRCGVDGHTPCPSGIVLPDLPRRWLRNVNHKQPVVTKDGLDRRRILPKSPLVEAVRFESQRSPES